MVVRNQPDPELAGMLDNFPTMVWSVETLPAIRTPRMPPPELSDAVERVDHTVPGDPDVVIRVHRPKGATTPLPAVYSMHGGGYLMGTYEMDDARMDRWCQMFQCVGVSVEYRLAPETPYPGPLDDCYAGLRYVFDHAAELGVDPDRIGIRGESAGGGLAAGLALLARDRGELSIAFQLLECPMIDDRRVTPSSQMPDLKMWSRETNAFGWRSYLGGLFGSDDVPIYAAPARATDLTGLPPAIVLIGTVDVFCDEDIDYAQRLIQADVPTELHVYPGVPHGLVAFPTTRAFGQWRADVENWLGRQLAGG